ncbi:MAG: glycerol-3-phosphate 1-O-acyltransferase PlsY [Acidobacteria bacterium]|jgi:glycerol-3-phosphate acyltransferase PlsY|nr:glycerol-3-phosphate 1-O-acyltransferase PlsY [Acidobacteriota bacterium]
MMTWLCLGFSYLLGSIPFGYLLVRVFHGEDVRQTGSGNIGATNVSRKSPGLGVLTLLLDGCKGIVAVLLTKHFLADRPGLAACAGLAAVLGHMFPLWLNFRGGKGVATGLGSFLLLAPKAILVAAGIFVAVLLLFRRVSLASIIAVAAFPLLARFLQSPPPDTLSLTVQVSVSFLIIVKHHDNIRRLLAGTENRVSFSRGPK